VASQCLYAGNANLASASQWHRSVFTLAIQTLLGIAVASQRLHAVIVGLASASPWHRSVFTPAMQASLRLRSGIAAYSRWQCRSRFGFAVASQHLHAFNAGLATATQWHRSVFTLAMQASLRLRNGFAMASQCLHAGYPGLASALQLHRSVFMLAMRASLGIAEASQRLHAVNVSFASASQWCFSVFTLAMHALCRRPMRCLRAEFELGLRFGFALSSQCLCARQAGLASASQRRRSIFTLAI
jgi:acid stress-induced BolA-like protein IbaG/YrbA